MLEVTSPVTKASVRVTHIAEQEAGTHTPTAQLRSRVRDGEGPSDPNLDLAQGQPWVPGTSVMYRRPRGGPTRRAEQGFPAWEVAGWPPQTAMFQAADQICQHAFYVAADQWNGPRLVKIFSAFGSALDFLKFLQTSRFRCFYEVI